MGTNPKRHVKLKGVKDILEELERCDDKSSVTSSENDPDENTDDKDLGDMFVYIFYITFSYCSFPR